MKFKEVMTAGAKACMPETSLADAASLMWENDCGALPVVSVDDKVVGIITDRDICFGATTKNSAPAVVSVGEIITGQVFTCGPEDDIREALLTMRRSPPTTISAPGPRPVVLRRLTVAVPAAAGAASPELARPRR